MRAALLAFTAVLALAAPCAAQVSSPVQSPLQPPTGGATLGQAGSTSLGGVVTYMGVPAGATCKTLRNGTAVSGATSCSSYTIVSGDQGNALALQVTTTALSIPAAGGNAGQLFFPTGNNAMLLGIL